MEMLVVKPDKNYISTHVCETIGRIDVEGYVDTLIHELKNMTEGYEYCYIEDISFGGDPLFSVRGWREYTPAELEARAVQRAKDREAKAKAKAKLEEAERAQLAKLKAKYEKNG